MQGESNRHKVFGRRMIMLGGGKLLLLSTLVGRMYYLQVIDSERYATLADENRIRIRLLPPPRGRIVDRFGVPMADNRQNYRVLVIPEQAAHSKRTRAADIGAVLDSLGRIIEIGDGDRRRILREVERKRSFVPVTIRENLSWRDVAQIEVNTPDLPGVSIDVGQTRHYPHGTDTSPVLGYVAAVSEKELSGDPLLETPGFRIGKSGVEKVYDMALRGSGGRSYVEENAFGRPIRELSRQEGQPGNEIALTIDLELQKMVSRRLGEESAAVVVLDVKHGEVLALASSPSYDSNAFNRGLTTDEWRSLVNNPRGPLTNKAIAGQYSPGSTFKPVVALAALERGVITPETRIFCPGHVQLGNARFHCWKRGGHGSLDLHDAIKMSCDVYFYEVARRTGIDNIAAMARRFGLGEALDIDLNGERNGLMPTRDWKQATIGTPWQKGETLIAGIGQGYILVTPLQLAVMTARIANGGHKVTPRLTRDRVTEKGIEPWPAVEPESLGVRPQHLAVVQDAMNAVVNERRGTALRARIKQEGFEMAGKSGTVQVRRISRAERIEGVRKNEDLPWRERDHALFVAYAPVDNPRYAVAVVVEHGGGGSSVAAPIAHDVLVETQRRDPIRTSSPSPVTAQAEPVPLAPAGDGG